MSVLIKNGGMDIAECNVPVKSADAFFSDLCAPDALARYYNPFGEWIVDFFRSLNVVQCDEMIHY